MLLTALFCVGGLAVVAWLVAAVWSAGVRFGIFLTLMQHEEAE